MRNTPGGCGGAIPLTVGGKKRAATLDITINAVKPCHVGKLPRMAYPGILERSHSMGRVMGLVPRMLKSYPLCVYFQMYSPLKTKYFPKACSRPAWNSLRKPGAQRG